MRQKEKSKISKDKIINAAIVEFGTKNYENASLNTICNDNNISKGLIYHYFKNKDELFLECVRICFHELIKYLSVNNITKGDFQEVIKEYVSLRYDFFQQNPQYSNLFFQTVLQPPVHLRLEIKELRRDFDEFNLNNYRYALESVTLRDGISKDEAVEYFLVFQEMFNAYFQNKIYEGYDFNLLVKDHEVNIRKLLNIMLYGIVWREREE